jgi:class 3 adenylate cyclase
MAEDYPYELLEDTSELSGYRGWKEQVYHDFLALQRGSLSTDGFRAKYSRTRAVLSLDMTGLTSCAMHIGELESLLRVLDAQRVCIPVLRDFGAELIRCFADDMVAVFEDPESALNAAFEIHHRAEIFNNSKQATANPTQCCIGIGFGELFAIGPNLAQGDEMNRASKLGEDIARARETLLTESAFDALNHLAEIQFELQTEDDQLFPFYRALPSG